MKEVKKQSKGKFRFRGRFIHLTYKTHINIDILKTLISKKIKKRIVKIKVAHETADSEHDYLHTHCLMFINLKVDWKCSRRMDIIFDEVKNNIHPHLKPIESPEHWFNTWKYLDKENCILDELNGNEFPTNSTDDLKRIIQSHKTWKDVMNDDLITGQIQRVMTWAREVFNARPLPNLSKDIILRTWQKDIIDLLENQNNRNVLWIYDKIGGNGKSVLTNYLIDTKNAFMCNGGKIGDIAYAYDYQEIAVFDLPRCCEEFAPYRAMECFKDGRFFSSKYTSCLKRFKPVSIVIFANFLPDVEKLSKDRWIIKELKGLILRDYDISRNPRIPGVALTLSGDPWEKFIIEEKYLSESSSSSSF